MRRLTDLEQLGGVGADHVFADRGSERGRLADEVVVGIRDEVLVARIAVREGWVGSATTRGTPPGSGTSAAGARAPGRARRRRPLGDRPRRAAGPRGRRRPVPPSARARGDRPRTAPLHSHRASARRAPRARARSGRARRPCPARTPPSRTGREAGWTWRGRADRARAATRDRRALGRPRATSGCWQ